MKARGRSAEPGRGQRGTSRDSSVSSSGREVRCGCQFFQSDSLLPERVSLVGRPPSRTSNAAMATHIGDHEYEAISPPPDVVAGGPGAAVRARLGLELDGLEAELGSPARGPFARTDSDEKRERRFLRIPLDDELVMTPCDGDTEEATMRSRELGDNLGGSRDEMDDEAEAEAAAAAVAVAAAAAAVTDEEELSAQEVQARMEERYFAATPTTTESRTDCDVNTSQLDSSGLEDLPLKRDARKKKSSPDGLAEKQSQARNLQQRIRSQAGRLRTKLRSMPRPKFSMPERPKFTMPERPKFNLPERPKFNLPERPKFTRPELPKFNLPERPKFTRPELPKFNLPERPKFNLPERPKFTRPELPKFHLPQRPKLSMPTLSSLSRSTLSRSSGSSAPKKGTSSTRRPLRERPSSLSSASSSAKRMFFDFDLKTYPRIFDRKAKRADYATSSPKATRAQTPPPEMPMRRKGPIGQRWVHRFSDIKYADDENQPPKELADGNEDARMDISAEDVAVFDERPPSALTESTTAFRDKDYGYTLELDARQAAQAPIVATAESVGESDREQRSSGSSSDRRRAGVLEEIDSDEFFLREKGLSQEDVAVGRYLTSEIRDAFRSPAGALSHDFYDDDEVEQLAQRYRGTPEREPMRPARTRSLRPRKREKGNKTPSPTQEKDINFYNTFPPARPKRVRRLPKPLPEDRDQKQSDRPAEEYEEEEGEIIQEYEEKMDDSEADAEVEAVGLDEPSPLLGKRRSPAIMDDLADMEAVMHGDDEQWPVIDRRVIEEDFQPPLAPKRKHRSQRELQDEEILLNGHYTKDDWLENVEAQLEAEGPDSHAEPDYIIPASPEEQAEVAPVAPKRGRQRGSRAASRATSLAASLADEDRTSRGASSLPSEREPDADELAAAAALEAAMDAAGGYASVDKSLLPERPDRPRRPKPPRPPPPSRRRRAARLTTNDVSHFWSLPRRAIRAPPVRPMRNYSTLGPARPPRRRVPQPEDVQQVEEQKQELELGLEVELEQEQERKSAAYMEIEDIEAAQISRVESEDTHGSARHLQSGDVIEKMKARPLPPPPRPPRKSKDAGAATDEGANVEEEVLATEAAEPLGVLSDSVVYAREEETAPFTQLAEEVRHEEEEALRAAEAAELQLELELELDQEMLPEEVSVATQTDPLPDDVCVQAEEPREPLPMADAFTETSPIKELPAPPPPPPEPIIIEKPVPYYVMPDPDTEVELKAQRLQVSELDVERLNVGELQAQKILVSDIDGMTMQVAELSSKSGHLVVSGIELPSGFLQELVDSRIAAAPPPTPAPVPTPIPVPVTTSNAESTPASASVPAPLAQTITLETSDPPSLSVQTTASDSAIASSPESPLPSGDSRPPSTVPSAPSQPASTIPTGFPTAAQLASPLAAPFYLSHALHSLQSAPPELLHSFIPDYFASLPPPGRGSSRSRSHMASQRDLESEEEATSVSLPPRRRRHPRPPAAARFSSDEEEEDAGADQPPPSRRSQRTTLSANPAPTASTEAPTSDTIAQPPDPSVVELGRQLVVACHAAVLRAVRTTLVYANSQLQDQEDKRRDLQVALCLLLVLVAGLVLLGCFGSGQQHHHHWDFFFPPSR